jgi:type VI secretion system protein ImpJ
MRARKLVWTEGLFITQHHLQQLDRYHEQLLHERLSAFTPYGWGISEIEIDERALATGQFRLQRLMGVFPDGTPIAVGDNLDDAIPPRPLDTALTPQVRVLDVFVGLSQETDAGANVDLDAKPGALNRYVREHGALLDYNVGTGEHPLQFARRNLRIVLGEERQDALDLIRVAQLVRSPGGTIVVRDGFVPPVLRIGASPYLMNGFVRLLEVMTAKQRSLSETRRQRTEAAVEFQASDAAKFWLLNALNQTIPVLAHLVDQGSSTPEVAYVALGQLIGLLCTFAVDADLSTIPKFTYLDLGECFGPMLQRAYKLLDAVIAEKYTEVPLTKRADGMYLGQIEDRTLLRCEFFVAAMVGGKVADAQVRERLPRLSKIASWGQINSILNSAINGAKLELEYRPPGALPVRNGVVYFKLTKTPEIWNDIAGTGTIAIYQPVEPDLIDLTLYAVDPANLR